MTDPAAPLPVLPVCLGCGHPRIAHTRRGCRAEAGSGLFCGCTCYADPPDPRPAPGTAHPDDPEDTPS